MILLDVDWWDGYGDTAEGALVIAEGLLTADGEYSYPGRLVAAFLLPEEMVAP